MTDAEFDPELVAEAERLDREITDVLAGRPDVDVDPVALWLATSLRTSPPPRVRSRISRAIGHGAPPAGWAYRLPRLVAAALALVFVGHGVGNLILGEWVAAQLGEPHAPHAYIEGAWAIAAVGIAVGAGALRRRWLPVSAGAGVPLGVLLGAHGVSEFAVFPAGAVLHTAEGVLAIVLLVTWWISRRYGTPRRAEERA